jgi:hypothetical protein
MPAMTAGAGKLHLGHKDIQHTVRNTVLSPERLKSALGGAMKGMSECAVLTIALAVVAQPVLARTYLNCSTRKVIIISTPRGDTSSRKEKDLGFWVDDAARTLTFVDNTPLTVSRFDRAWISANRDGIFYELDRQDGTLTYAASTMKDTVTTTIVGAGRCEIAATPKR